MTNYEWLLQMGGEERQAWFDAEHVDDCAAARSNDGVIAEYVDANDVSTRKGDVRADGVCANDVDVSQDSREKLEEDVRKWCAMMGMQPYQLDFIYGWLDRQDAITRREALTQPDERDEQLVELTAERDALADDLLTCNREREEYRRRLSDVLDLIYRAYHVGSGAYD